MRNTIVILWPRLQIEIHITAYIILSLYEVYSDFVNFTFHVVFSDILFVRVMNISVDPLTAKLAN